MVPLRAARWAVPLAVVLVGCGPADFTLEAEVRPHPELGVLKAGLAVAEVAGCDTAALAGLNVQLTEELRCGALDSLAQFAGGHTNLLNGVVPYLTPAAAQALKLATNDAQDHITLSHAYRTAAAQFLLNKGATSGACSVHSAETPGLSTHQSGRAIDTPNYTFWRPYLEAHGWRWAGAGDPTHFEYANGPSLGPQSVLAFQKLWNRNSASKLDEDGLWGPASAAAMGQAPAEGFPIHGCPALGALNGVVNGKVFQLNAASPDNVSEVIPGATVSAGGQSTNTDANGFFTFDLPAGTYELRAVMTGYELHTTTVVVTAGSAVSKSLGMTMGGTPGVDLAPPVIRMISPSKDGQFLESSEATVLGAASDLGGQVTKIGIALNDGPEVVVPLIDGRFTHKVTLAPGDNTFRVNATDSAGNASTVTLSRIAFRPGLSGAVVLDEETRTPVPNAWVVLEDANGFEWKSALTDERGRFALDVSPVPFEGRLTFYGDGFITLRRHVSVTSAHRDFIYVGLPHGKGDFDGQSPQLRFVNLPPGSSVADNPLQIKLTVSGFEPTKVRVGEADAIPSGGEFVARVKLEDGSNEIEAVATDAAGRQVKAFVTVVRGVGSGTSSEGREAVGGCSVGGSGMFGPVGLVLVALWRQRRTQTKAVIPRT